MKATDFALRGFENSAGTKACVVWNPNYEFEIILVERFVSLTITIFNCWELERQTETLLISTIKHSCWEICFTNFFNMFTENWNVGLKMERILIHVNVFLFPKIVRLRAELMNALSDNEKLTHEEDENTRWMKVDIRVPAHRTSRHSRDYHFPRIHGSGSVDSGARGKHN